MEASRFPAVLLDSSAASTPFPEATIWAAIACKSLIEERVNGYLRFADAKNTKKVRGGKVGLVTLTFLFPPSHFVASPLSYGRNLTFVS